MRIEDRWLQTSDRFFRRFPRVLQGLFVVLGAIGVLMMLIPELKIGLPLWLRMALFTPLLLMLALVFIPLTLLHWGRALSWPIRKLASLARERR